MKDIPSQVSVLGELLVQRNLFLSTAESCTGGLISHLLTNQPGSSEWYLGGVLAYSNLLKTKVLGVDKDLLSKHGAVSGECVLSMVRGISGLTGSQVCISVSGIAGPGGGTAEKPVGTVYIAWGFAGDLWWEKKVFQGERLEVKFQTAQRAIEVLLEYLMQLR